MAIGESLASFSPLGYEELDMRLGSDLAQHVTQRESRLNDEGLSKGYVKEHDGSIWVKHYQILRSY